MHCIVFKEHSHAKREVNKWSIINITVTALTSECIQSEYIRFISYLYEYKAYLQSFYQIVLEVPNGSMVQLVVEISDVYFFFEGAKSLGDEVDLTRVRRE